MTYAEFLKSQGATDEDLKVLDTPIARKAWEVQQAEVTSAKSEAQKAREAKEAYDKWYQEQAVPYSRQMEQDLIAAKAESARNAEIIKQAQERGLLEVAANNPNPANRPDPNTPPSGFDPNKYIDRETFMSTVDREGEAIAAVADIAAEHAHLFPGQRLNFRELRKEAMSRRISVEALWMEKYNVQNARAARTEADRKAYEDKIRKEEREKTVQEMTDKFGNPDTRPAMPSSSPSPFAPRTGRDKQPWDSAADRSADRVAQVTRKIVQSQIQ